MTTTLEEKQRELDALQSAFDDYIASSRELEEELEAELTKCREFSSFIFLHASVPFYLAPLFTLQHATFDSHTTNNDWGAHVRE